MINRDAWNKHQWRKEPSWWDTLEVHQDEIRKKYADVFEWLEEVAPNPYEHDYILYTDGSGCTIGWGGYAAVWERIELEGDFRAPVSSGAIVNGSYGSTVQRSELNALLDGVHAILTERSRELVDQAREDTNDGLLFDIGTQGVLNQFTGSNRITILWYTDRSNLAHALLHDDSGSPLQARNKDRDLWMRWSFMAKYVCITPMCRPRNVVEGQAMCDALAGHARALLKDSAEALSLLTEKIYQTSSWKTIKPQTAIF